MTTPESRAVDDGNTRTRVAAYAATLREARARMADVRAPERERIAAVEEVAYCERHIREANEQRRRSGLAPLRNIDLAADRMRRFGAAPVN